MSSSNGFRGQSVTPLSGFLKRKNVWLRRLTYIKHLILKLWAYTAFYSD